MAESSSPPQHPVAEANANYVGIPGVRFVPSDEELILDYLRAKLDGEEQPTDLVQEAEVYTKHPKALTGELGKSVEGFWYVFAERQRKYPKGKRPSRSTGTAGRWKTVGKNVEVSFGADKKTIIGHKCALAYEVFVRSENQSRPRMVKTEWKMCEFVAEGTDKPISSAPTKMMLNDWVLCRITRKGEAGEILELKDGGQATLVEEAYEDEQLQNATPPDPSQQAQVQVQDLVEDGANGTEVGTQGFDADVEAPRDGDYLTDIQVVDYYHHPELWSTENECGEDFYHDPWNLQGNQFEATIDLDPMANQLVVPAEPDLGVLSLSEVVPTDPEPWDSASALLFPDDSNEPVMDEIVKPDVDTGKEKSKDNNTAANKPPRKT